MTNSEIDVVVSEVGPRDGLQSVKQPMSTEIKIQWIAALAGAGLREIEVGSFVSQMLLPQMADAEEVVGSSIKIPGLTVLALAPNFKGAERAAHAGVHTITMPVSASRKHSLANVRKTPEDAVDDVRKVRRLCDEKSAARRPKLEVGIATAFGCSIEGVVSEDWVIKLAVMLVEAGAESVGLSDSVGYANPAQVRRLFTALGRELGDKAGAAHFHNTRGQGLANVVAALDVGVRTFDASHGGLGGCPYAPGATGNIVTEDLVFLLESMGLKTGIDINRLIEARAFIKAGLPGEQIYGSVPDAGLPKGFRYAAELKGFWISGHLLDSNRQVHHEQRLCAFDRKKFARVSVFATPTLIWINPSSARAAFPARCDNHTMNARVLFSTLASIRRSCSNLIQDNKSCELGVQHPGDIVLPQREEHLVECNSLSSSRKHLGDQSCGPDIEFRRGQAEIRSWTGSSAATVLLCFVLNSIDGIDVLLISYLAPSITQTWQLDPSGLGVIFSSGLVGMAIGGIGLAPLADRFGRRKLILFSMLIMSCGMVFSGLAANFAYLALFRVAVGTGIGAILASMAALVAEVAPTHRQSFAVGLIQSGYPLGAVAIGLFTASAILHHSWRSILVSVGVLSLCMIPLVWLVLPESLPQSRPPNETDRSRATDPGGIRKQSQRSNRDNGFARLTDAENLRNTALLWCAVFFGFMVLYAIVSWIPKFAADAGLPAQLALYAGVIYNAGAFIGTVGVAKLGQSFGPGKIILRCMIAAAVLLIVFGSNHLTVRMVFVVSFALGATLQGGFNGLYSLAAISYPSTIRSTGIGWAMGIGRAGAVIGPITTGLAFSFHLPIIAVFAALAFSVLLTGSSARAMRPRVPG
jgi:hydroxymethylglutaryl-CoA lyase